MLPSASIEVGNGVVSGADSKKIRRVRTVQQGDMADIQLTLLGNQRHGQSELVVIRNQPALDGVGYRLLLWTRSRSAISCWVSPHR